MVNGLCECAPDDKLHVLRRPGAHELAEYAALFRPTSYGGQVAPPILRAGHEPAAMSKLASHRGAAAMTIIDSQVPAYDANTPKRPWHRLPHWPDHVTGDEMVAAMDKVGVD